jgi:hypothetical protein
MTVNDSVVAHWKLQLHTFYFAEIIGVKNMAEVSLAILTHFNVGSLIVTLSRVL